MAVRDRSTAHLQPPLLRCRELHTIERLLNAAAGLDYPRDRMEIQVLSVKLEGVVHLTSYLVHPMMLLVVLLTLPMSFSRSGTVAPQVGC